MSRINNKNNILLLLNNHLVIYPTPLNLNYMYSWGSMAGIVLMVQIVTGILLAMHYTPHVEYAFNSVIHLMMDVPNGIIIRYTHANGASLFFVVVYMHIFRGMYYSSGNQPRELVWITGVLILLLMIITAFIGYVLPWGQMSFWGATVITSLATVIPLVGKNIVHWLWGGFSIDHPTLNRFYSFHYTLPFLLAGLSIFHIASLHQYGSTNRAPFRWRLSLALCSALIILFSLFDIISLTEVADWVSFRGKASVVEELSRNLVCEITPDCISYGEAYELDTSWWAELSPWVSQIMGPREILSRLWIWNRGLLNIFTPPLAGVYGCKHLKLKNNNKGTGVGNTGPKQSFSSSSGHDPSEGKQASSLVRNPSRANSGENLKGKLILGQPSVLHTKVIELIKSSKNKDGRYGKLMNVISDPSVLIHAYLSIKGNKGNNTLGETLDGIDLDYFERISSDLKSGKFKFTPARRILIPKPNKPGEYRTLGIASPRQKIVQKAIQMVLSIIYEEKFLECSHGFRPGRGCHTALKRIQLQNVSTYSWIIEGDIQKFFDTIPHQTAIRLLGRTINCPTTLVLIKDALKAGFVDSDNGMAVTSDVGTPQGSVLSPLIGNIVLHELDVFITEVLGKEFHRGKTRGLNPEYRKLLDKYRGKKIDPVYRKLIRKIPSVNYMDSNFKRLHYTRYADDWVLLLSGSHEDAVMIKDRIKKYLSSELGLTLSEDKTKITSLRKGKKNFLGVEMHIRRITEVHVKHQSKVKRGGKNIIRRQNPRLIYHAPIVKLLEKLIQTGFVRRNKEGKFFPIGRASCINLHHADILRFYNSKIRGILNYYTCVHNRMRLWSIVSLLHQSCAITLARKFKLGQGTARSAFSKFGKDLLFRLGKTVVSIYRPENLRLLSMNQRFLCNVNFKVDEILRTVWSKGLTLPQFGEGCAICGEKKVEIHHIRSVKDVRARILSGDKISYYEYRKTFIRKSIPLCRQHHMDLHAGRLTEGQLTNLATYKGNMKRWK